MPLIGTEVTQTPIWGVQFVKLFPHPEDLAQLVANGGTLPEEYVPKSVLSACYGEYPSQAAYNAEPAGEYPSSSANTTGQFRCTGEAVRAIVNMTAFHAAASSVIAGLLDGSTTEDTVGVERARTAMDGTDADFGFGTSPFTVSAP